MAVNHFEIRVKVRVRVLGQCKIIEARLWRSEDTQKQHKVESSNSSKQFIDFI